jgi:hypothetical protein
VSDQPGSSPSLFPERGLAAFAALPLPARRALLAILQAAPAGVYTGGQPALAAALGKVLRSVERAVAVLLREGFVLERRCGPGRPAVLVLHPATALFAAAERGARQHGDLQRSGFPLSAPSVALAVGAVRRSDGTPFVPAPYLLELMTAAERDACVLAVASGAERLCADEAVSQALVALFRRRAKHDRLRASERARLLLRATGRDLDAGRAA